jgi:LysR family transcriptional activator of mexEF-oprN operon
MTSIDHFNLRSFDLNLLLAFDALVQERSVTRAAARLKIQQPAMSHALSTLRLLLGDELFVRTGMTMEPTPRASALAVPVRQILEQAQEALLNSPSFDPATERRTFKIGINGQLEVLLLPALMSALQRQAPGIRLIVRSISIQRVFDMLDAGEIDVAIGYLPGGASWHNRQLLLEEPHVCCFNSALVKSTVPIPMADYLASSHALITAANSLTGYLEDALHRAGVRLNVVLASHNLLSLVATASVSPVVVTLLRRAAALYAPLFNLSISPLPIDLASLPVDMIWHARTDRDAASAWLRQQIGLQLK